MVRPCLMRMRGVVLPPGSSFSMFSSILFVRCIFLLQHSINEFSAQMRLVALCPSTTTPTDQLLFVLLYTLCLMAVLCPSSLDIFLCVTRWLTQDRVDRAAGVKHGPMAFIRLPWYQSSPCYLLILGLHFYRPKSFTCVAFTVLATEMDTNLAVSCSTHSLCPHSLSQERGFSLTGSSAGCLRKWDSDIGHAVLWSDRQTGEVSVSKITQIIGWLHCPRVLELKILASCWLLTVGWRQPFALSS